MFSNAVCTSLILGVTESFGAMHVRIFVRCGLTYLLLAPSPFVELTVQWTSTVGTPIFSLGMLLTVLVAGSVISGTATPPLESK